MVGHRLVRGLPSKAVGWIDLVLAVLVVAAALRGLQLGAMIQVSSFVGFWVGLAAGVGLALAIARPLASGAPRSGMVTPNSRSIRLMVTALWVMAIKRVLVRRRISSSMLRLGSPVSRS